MQKSTRSPSDSGKLSSAGCAARVTGAADDFKAADLGRWSEIADILNDLCSFRDREARGSILAGDAHLLKEL